MKKRFILLTIISLIGFFHARSQVVVTVAGIGTEGYGGDTSWARTAFLHWPQDIAIDDSGSMYIADTYNNRIRKVDKFGKITTIAGDGFEGGTGNGGYGGDGGPATLARLYLPTGVTVDANRFVYIADSKNNRIRKVDTFGVITTIAGNGTAGFSGDGAAATLAQLYNPLKVAIDPTTGIIYIADNYNHCIRAIDPLSSNISTFAGMGGTPGYLGDGGAPGSAKLNYPADMAVDVSGNVYIADMANNVIRLVSGGAISTIAGIGTPGDGGDGRPATDAQLYSPQAIEVDDSGNVYISDLGTSRIRKFNPTTTNIIHTIVGTASAGFNGDGHLPTATQVNEPNGMAVTHKGNIYFADQGNNRIRAFIVNVLVNNVNADQSEVKVYPNPSHGAFVMNISSPVDEPVQVVISNVTGRMVYDMSTVTNKINNLDLQLQPGLYILTAITSGGKVCEKLVVE